MKKTFPVNINGTIFYIDEDAYSLLNTYLAQLRNAFPGEEGTEISSDIEGRISEHFTERIKEGARVITIDDVNRIIKVMGEPAELAGDADPAPAAATGPAAQNAPGQGSATTPPPFHGTPQQPAPVQKRLYRNPQNTVFGGVFGGLGVYLGWNVNLMRLFYVVLTLCTYFWPCVLVYFIAWMVIPQANTPRQLLEMQGMPVTPGSVGRTVLGTADPAAQTNQPGSGVTTAFAVIGKVILGFLGLIGGCLGLGFVVIFFISLCALIMYVGWADVTLLAPLDIENVLKPVPAIISLMCLSLAVLIPCIAAVWGACCALFKARGASRAIIISALVVEVLLIVATVVLMGVSDVDGQLLSAVSFSSPLPLA